MATYPGDPRARPDLAHCTIAATGPIKRKREELIGKTAVCWLNGNSHDTTPCHVADALEEQLHIDRREIKVVKHYPEQYLIIFDDEKAYNRVLQRQAVRNRGRVFNFDQWTERRGATVNHLEFRVRLRIEGVPVHAWSEEAVAKITGPNCAIHYVEGQSRHRDRTRTYDLWAWSFNPSKIPKRVTLSITDPDRDHTAADDVELYYDPPRGIKSAYDYKLHIHLDVVEDLSFLNGRRGREEHPNRKPRREFLWNYGEMDSRGKRRGGQNHDDRAGRDYRPRRDRDDHDHDDNFSRGVRRHRSQSSWGCITRCRGAVEDCYSSSRYRGGDSYHGGHSRMVAAGSTKAWRPKNNGKKVTFANPLVQILGLSTKEHRIRDMLATAPGWDHFPSPADTATAAQHLPHPLNKTSMTAI